MAPACCALVAQLLLSVYLQYLGENDDLNFQMVFAGMMCSSSIWGSISDKYGRKFVSLCKELI